MSKPGDHRPNNKTIPGPRPLPGSGGFRIPSAAKIRAVGTEIALHIADKVEILEHRQPVQLKIFKLDLDKLRMIGKGNYRRGFYRMLDMSHEIHLEKKRTGTTTQNRKG